MLKKIDKKDLVVGQEVLTVWVSSSVENAFKAFVVNGGPIFSHSGAEFSWLNDVPKPEFVVPWGTRQLSADGTVWEFMKTGFGKGVAYVGSDVMNLGEAELAAPFHRLFTVAELVEVLEDGCGEAYLATRLSDLEVEGVL